MWDATDYLADLAYNTLRYRGFRKADIQYLSPVTNTDVDGDGLTNDVALATTWANAAQTFTNWVGNASQLIVYLVDHGEKPSGQPTFRLNETEVLTAAQLDISAGRPARRLPNGRDGRHRLLLLGKLPG